MDNAVVCTHGNVPRLRAHCSAAHKRTCDAVPSLAPWQRRCSTGCALLSIEALRIAAMLGPKDPTELMNQAAKRFKAIAWDTLSLHSEVILDVSRSGAPGIRKMRDVSRSGPAPGK